MTKKNNLIWIIVGVVMLVFFWKTLVALLIGLGLLTGGGSGLFAVTSNYDSCTSYPMENLTNLISNGDFESGPWAKAGDCNCLMASCKSSSTFNPNDYQNWKVDITSATLGQAGEFFKKDSTGNFIKQGSYEFLARENSDATNGFKSLELVGRRANACIGKWVDAKSNTKYTLSFWFKSVNKPSTSSSGSSQDPRYIIVQNAGAKQIYSPSVEIPVSDNVWHYYQSTFTTDAATTKLGVHLYAQGGAGEGNESTNIIRYDDLRLVEGELPCLSSIGVPTDATGGFDWNQDLFPIGDFQVKMWMALAAGAAILLFIFIK